MTLVGKRSLLLRVGRAAAALAREKPAPMPAPHPAWVIAHRGAARVAAENTVEAFGKAMELGADGVEADVCVTKDGRFVIWHDAGQEGEVALARQSGREHLAYTPDVPRIGSTWRRPVRELPLLDFRRHYGYTPRRGGVRDVLTDGRPPEVPPITLEDLFAWVDRERRARHVCLDVKLLPDQIRSALDLVEAVRSRVLREGARRDVVFHYLCPQREVLEAIARVCRERPLPEGMDVCADFEYPGALAVARELGFRRVSMGMGRRIWKEFRSEVGEVVLAREKGDIDSVIVWTINEADRFRELADLGVDGILTDDPATLRKIVRA